MNKKELRRYFRTETADWQYILSAGRQIENRLLSSPLFQKADRVFCYLSTNREPSTERIIEACLREKKLYVPKCLENGEMAAVRITGESDLKENRFGIREPATIGETARHFDLIIVPCLACGRNGARLGHGGGYYDRFLKNSTGKTVCLCFERNITDGIPMDDNDVFMEIVMSEEAEYGQ